MNECERAYLRVGYGHVFVRNAYVLEFLSRGWRYMPVVTRCPSCGVWLFKSIPEVEVARA